MVYGLNSYPTQGYSVEYEALDGDIKAVKLLDDTPDEGGRPSILRGGRPIDPTHVPTRVRWKDRKKLPMGDFDGGPIESVSARAKALIERFEPEMHQFLPVEFVDIDGNFLEHRWFLIVCNRLDTIDRKQVQGFLLWRGKSWTPIQDYLRDMPNEIPPGYDATQKSKLVFNLTQIGLAHLWVDKHLSSSILISDEFGEAISAAGLTGTRHFEDRLETN